MSSADGPAGHSRAKGRFDSNTNVLELTAASASATAGTHTVTVNSLAQTASGYLAEISDSSSALSGQITFEMGNGKAETFVMGGQPPSGAAANTTYTGSRAATLASLASAINSSGVGITANVESRLGGFVAEPYFGNLGRNRQHRGQWQYVRRHGADLGLHPDDWLDHHRQSGSRGESQAIRSAAASPSRWAMARQKT